MPQEHAFTRLVHERMKKTGEGYRLARAHVLAGTSLSASDRPGVFPTVRHIGGQQPDISPVRNLLVDAGVRLPGDYHVSEAMVFGLAGGIGFLYGVFEYEGTPTMTLAVRNRSTPDAFFTDLFERTGTTVEVQTTSGAAKAAKQLDKHLDEQNPVLCSLGAGALPHTGGPAGEAGMWPRVVRVIGMAGPDVWIDDISPEPLACPRASLDTARGALRSAKHRMISISGIDPGHDWPAAITEAVQAGARGYDTPPVPQWASNVGTAGLERWQGLLTNTRNSRGWPRFFAGGHRAAIALSRLYESIERDSAFPAAGRPLYAGFLDAAAALTGRGSLGECAANLRVAASHWGNIARIAATADPDLARYCAIFDEQAELLDTGSGPDIFVALAALREEQQALVAGCAIDGTTATDAYTAIAAELHPIIRIERTVMKQLIS